MASTEEENKSLHQACDRLRSDVQKVECELQEAKDRAVISREALMEIKEALSLLIDVVNKAKLFNEQMEKQEKLNRGHIIRYLSDQARKMEKTCRQMQLMVGSLVPKGSVQEGTQTQTRDPSLPICSCPTDPSLDKAHLSPEAPIDLAGNSNFSGGSPGFTTPAPTLLKRIDWKNIELPNIVELARVVPFQ